MENSKKLWKRSWKVMEFEEPKRIRTVLNERLTHDQWPIHFDVYSRLFHLKCAKRVCQESIIVLSILSAYRTRYSAFPASCDSRETSKRTSFQIQTESGEAEKQTGSGNQANCCYGTQRESGECG